MDDLIATLYTFEAEHAWWTPETFLRLDNRVLKDAAEDAFQHHKAYLQTLLREATKPEMDALKIALEKGAPKMLPITLACLLDRFHHAATELEQPVSKEAVAWYREQGWKFPDFPHEK